MRAALTAVAALVLLASAGCGGSSPPAVPADARIVVTSRSQDQILREGFVRAVLVSQRRGEVALRARLGSDPSDGGSVAVTGELRERVRPGVRAVRLPLTADGRRALAGCDRALLIGTAQRDGARRDVQASVLRTDREPCVPPARTALPPLAPADITPGAPAVAAGGGLPFLDRTTLRRTMELARSTGARWIRFDVDWRRIEPRRDAPLDWAKTDMVVREAVRAGLNVLPIIDGAPRWARAGAAESGPPRDPLAFARFAALVAARYGPLGVHAYEVWNEPNYPAFWSPPSPERYTALLRATAQALRAADPQARVIAGGLARVGQGGGRIQPDEFLRRMYAAGAKPWFDVAAIHPYSTPALPTDAENPMNAWRQLDGPNAGFRAAMRAAGDGEKPVWITEYGAPTGGEGGVSEAQQAAIRRSAFQLARRSLGDGPLFWYAIQDSGTSPTDSEQHYGLFRADGSPKPAAAIR